MKSLTVSKNNTHGMLNSGFTLIEILVTMGILGIIFAGSHFISLDSYGIKLLETEHASLISILQKARNRSMNNVFESSHGVHIELNEYVIFRKLPYDPNENTNEHISRNPNISITGINELSFEQLSGEPDITGEIILYDGTRTKRINIIKGGLIDW